MVRALMVVTVLSCLGLVFAGDTYQAESHQYHHHQVQPSGGYDAAILKSKTYGPPGVSPAPPLSEYGPPATPVVQIQKAIVAEAPAHLLAAVPEPLPIPAPAPHPYYYGYPAHAYGHYAHPAAAYYGLPAPHPAYNAPVYPGYGYGLGYYGKYAHGYATPLPAHGYPAYAPALQAGHAKAAGYAVAPANYAAAAAAHHAAYANPAAYASPATYANPAAIQQNYAAAAHHAAYANPYGAYGYGAYQSYHHG